MSIRSHQLVFRPRARLVSILGEHLISDQAVGLVELVKNAYDADATEVRVEILNLADADQTTVIVSDNGVGMTLDDVRDKWLSPAVSHKERDKLASRRTARGRLPIGEKGVGRFAVHQIGRELEMVTRSAAVSEVVLRVRWDQFDEGKRYLDGMPIEVHERDPEVFTDGGTGTRLTMRGARSAWSEGLLRKVHRTLRRLQSPLPDENLQFHVRLRCPEFPEFENVDPTDILEKAHYEFRALVDRDGQCDFEYVCAHPTLAQRSISRTETLVALAAEQLGGSKPRCGPFYLNLYVWDRSRDHLRASGVSARELDAQCGVSLFRDGLRVLPYGEPGDDWLLLDQERIQAPADRIGNNQVIGLVLVDQETNLLLRDKTNREGLIENDAFMDLRALVRAAIRLFLTRWRSDRPRSETGRRTRHGSVEDAKRVATAVMDTARTDVEVRLPEEVAGPAAGTSAHESASWSNEGGTVVSQRQAMQMLLEHLEGAERSMTERERRLEVLLNLAATGMAAERVVHEFGRQVTAAFESLDRMRAGGPSTAAGPAPLDVLETCLQTLRSEFRVLAPYEGVRRVQRARDVSALEAAGLALTLNRALISAGAIRAEVEGQDFSVRVRPAALIQVLDNVVSNATHWVATLPEGSPRRVVVVLDPATRKVLISDSGPGVHEEAAEHLFEAFFSMKAEGTGLGLHISAELARRMGAQLRLAGPEEASLLPSSATGATFVLHFAPGHESPNTHGVGVSHGRT